MENGAKKLPAIIMDGVKTTYRRTIKGGMRMIILLPLFRYFLNTVVNMNVVPDWANGVLGICNAGVNSISWITMIEISAGFAMIYYLAVQQRVFESHNEYDNNGGGGYGPNSRDSFNKLW